MAQYRALTFFSFSCLMAATFSACEDAKVVSSSGYLYDASVPTDGSRILADGAPLPGLSVGAACSTTAQCRPGRVCTSGACALSQSGAVDSACAAAGECQSGLQCFLGTCRAPNATAGGADS